MIPGIYKAEWGRGGQVLGGGVMKFEHNRIEGADINGVTFEGEYAFDDKGNVAVQWLKLHVPANVALAQGDPPMPRPSDVDMPAITLNMADDGPTTFQMPTKPFPLTVRLTRMPRLETGAP
jgi:hypothetical protein